MTKYDWLILGHLGIGWSQRATLASSLRLPFWTNPVLLASIALGVGSLLLLVYTEIGRSLFHTAPLSIECWMLALLLAPLPLLGAELTKLVIRHRAGRATRKA